MFAIFRVWQILNHFDLFYRKDVADETVVAPTQESSEENLSND
jgi:hypothetical protein